MRRVRLNHVVKKRCTDIGASALLCLGMASAHAQSVDIVLPGTTTQFDIASSSGNCSTKATTRCFNRYSNTTEQCIGANNYMTTICSADADPLDNGPQLRVIAASSFSIYSNTEVESIATLSRSIQVPVPTSGPYSTSLPVQVATEVAWSGGAIVAGFDLVNVQVIATFQIRDVTDATAESPGPVVASDTFLWERTDADLQVPFGAGAVFTLVNLLPEFVDISNSSGTDVTALLERGRTYRIELEAKCVVDVPWAGWGVCLFSKDAPELLSLVTPVTTGFPAWDNDGFAVSDFTVTVGSDPVQGLPVTP